MMMTCLTNRKKRNQQYNSNFPIDFIEDFDLGYRGNTDRFNWKLHDKAKRRFHAPVTYMDLNGDEGIDHYSQKRLVHDYIYENYYLTDECKFYVTSELEQVDKPFKARTDGKEKIFYKLDVLVLRASDHQLFDIEIDGPEHRKSNEAILKDRVRDELLEFRYGIYTLRFDRDEPINYRKIDEFLKKDAKEYTRTRIKNGEKKVVPAKKSLL